MSFPLKPDFFDLTESECRLLAPSLAFQKLMQAPRGNQLKIKGNVVNVPADVNNIVNDGVTTVTSGKWHNQSSVEVAIAI